MKEILSEYGRTLAGSLVCTLLLLILQLPLGDILYTPLEERLEQEERITEEHYSCVDQEITRLKLQICMEKDCLICGEVTPLEECVRALEGDRNTVPLQIGAARRRENVEEEWEDLPVQEIWTASQGLCFESGGIYQLLMKADSRPEEQFLITLVANVKE